MFSQTNKQKRSCSIIAVVAIILFCSVSRFFLAHRADLRHAFSLSRLPLSVRIVESRRDALTDYIFEATITMDPTDFNTLLTGRNFKKTKTYQNNVGVYRFLQDPTFKVDTAWIWLAEDNKNKDVMFRANCIILVNATRDQAYVHFAAD